MSQVYKSFSSGSVPTDVATSYVTDNGTAVPLNNVLKVNGGTDISTALGTSNQIIINSSFNPNSVVSLVDDFVSIVAGDGNGTYASQLGWGVYDASGQGLSPDVFPIDSGHPGVVTFNWFYSGAGWVALVLGGDEVNYAQPFQSFILGGGAISMNWVVKIHNLSNSTNRYQLLIGFSDTSIQTNQTTSYAVPPNGIFFSYSDNLNGGDWQVISGASSTYTTVNTTVAASTAAYHNFGMVINAAASSVSFTIDGVAVGTIATNIPTGVGMTPFLLVGYGTNQPTGTDGTPVYIDLFYLQQILTTAR